MVGINLYTFLFTSLIAFLGLFVGAVLSYYTKDEVHQFKRFIPLLQYFFLMLVFILFFIYFPVFVALMFLILTFLFIFFFWRKKDLNILDYIAFSILLAFSSLNVQMHLYLTITIFLFGLFSGALFYVLHTKPSKKHKSKHAHRLHIQHHMHTGKNLSYGGVLTELFNRYYFFIILTIVSFIFSYVLSCFI